MTKRPPTRLTRLAHAPALAPVAIEPRCDDVAVTRERSSRVGRTILIVDNDLGFLYWLGCTLSGAGYLPLPALNCEEAIHLVRRLDVRIDLLVIDSGMPGAGELAMGLGRACEHLKIIAVAGSRKEPVTELSAVEMPRVRRACEEAGLASHWVQTVRGVIASECVNPPGPN